MTNLSPLLPATSPPASNKVYTFQEPYPQHLSFSISLPIIRYIIKNPKSGIVWKKLIQTCKYFYSKFPVLPIGRIRVDYLGERYVADEEQFNPSSFFPQLWIYDSFSNTQGVALAVIFFSWNDYKKLTSSGTIKKLEFYRAFIINDNETVVPFDKLVENLHNLETLIFTAYKDPYQQLFTAESATKMIEHLMSFKNMSTLYLSAYVECIDFSLFVDFLMKNEIIDVHFDYRFEVSDAFKQMLENVLKEVRENPRLKTPRVCFYNN